MWQLLFAQVLLEMFHWVPFWTVTLRCLSAAHKRLVASTAVRLLKRAEPADARAGESPAVSFGLTRLGLFQKSMPPLLVPADCGTIPLRTSHAVSQGSNWTRSERARRCTHRRDPHKSGPPSSAAGRGPSRWRRCSSRPAHVCSVRRSRGRPQPFWARKSRAPAPGDARVPTCRARRVRCSSAAA